MERDIIANKGINITRYPSAKTRSEKVYYGGSVKENGISKKIRLRYKYGSVHQSE